MLLSSLLLIPPIKMAQANILIAPLVMLSTPCLQVLALRHNSGLMLFAISYISIMLHPTVLAMLLRIHSVQVICQISAFFAHLVVKFISYLLMLHIATSCDLIPMLVFFWDILIL